MVDRTISWFKGFRRIRDRYDRLIPFNTLGTRLACLGNPEPVGMKVYAPAGEEAFDDIQTTEEAQARADRRKAA